MPPAARGVEFPGSAPRRAPSASRACAHAVEGAGLAQDAGDAGQRLEVVGAGALRREQQEEQVDRLAVEGLEVDRLVEAREQAEQAVELRQLAVRDGDAVADAGRAEALALQQRLEDRALVEAGEARGVRARARAAPASCRSRARQARRPRASGNRAGASMSLTSSGRTCKRRPTGAWSHASLGPGAGPASGCRDGGSIQPIAPSRRRYTTFTRPVPAWRKTSGRRAGQSSSSTASLTESRWSGRVVSAITTGW